MKNLIIVVLIFTGWSGFSQDPGDNDDTSAPRARSQEELQKILFEGCVVSLSGVSVSWPSISISCLGVVITDSSGCFTVNFSKYKQENAQLKVSAPGYHDTVIPVTSLRQSPEVSLREKKVIRQTCEPNAHKKEKETHILGIKRECKCLFRRVYCGKHPGYQLAVFIKNDLNNPVKVNRVEAYIAEVGEPVAPLRLRIYTLDTIVNHFPWGDIQSYRPGEDLLINQIVRRVEYGGNWIEFNLEDLNVCIPGNGAVFALEYVYDGDDFYHDHLYGPCILASYNKEEMPVLTFNNVTGNWRKFLFSPVFTNRYRTPTIRVVVQSI